MEDLGFQNIEDFKHCTRVIYHNTSSNSHQITRWIGVTENQNVTPTRISNALSASRRGVSDYDKLQLQWCDHCVFTWYGNGNMGQNELLWNLPYGLVTIRWGITVLMCILVTLRWWTDLIASLSIGASDSSSSCCCWPIASCIDLLLACLLLLLFSWPKWWQNITHITMY